MLALVLTLILALYILGPDLVSRLIVSQFAPARPRNRNRSEEVAQAVVISVVPVAIAWAFAHFYLHRFNNVTLLKDFLQGLYGEESLTHHTDAFLAAAAMVIRLNFRFIIVPVYSAVVIISITIGLLIRNYGILQRKWEKDYPRKSAALTWLVRPWVADWHLKLSRDLLPSSAHYISVDVLTKLDILYRGTLDEHHLAPDGSLVSITLIKPQKFQRQELLEARAAAKIPKSIKPAQFWTAFEARYFVVMASEIVTLNVNYVDPKSLTKKLTRVRKAAATIALAAAQSTRVSRSTKKPPTTNTKSLGEA